MQSLRSVKVTTLIDNLVQTLNGGGVLGEWGLSFLLEMEDVKGRMCSIIFDTGAIKEAVLLNLKRLKVNLSNVECIVLSHGHLDHTATTVEILSRIKGEVKVIAHPHVFLPKIRVLENGERRYIGVPKGEGLKAIEKVGGQVILTSEPFKLFPGASTTGQIPRVTDFERIHDSDKAQVVTVVDGETVPDRILDDQALLMKVEGLGLLVVTGCAHSGVVNTIMQAQKISGVKKLYGLIGGLHLFGRKDSYRNLTLKELKATGLKLISPCHCTGFKATTAIYQTFPKEFVLNYSGRTINIGEELKPKIF